VSQANNHLDIEQIEWFLRDPAGPQSKGTLSDLFEQASRHLACCEDCQKLVSMQRESDQLLHQLRGSAREEATAACPPESSLRELAAGVAPSERTHELLGHATACDHCGNLLREEIENLNLPPTAEEEALVGRLPSARPVWQRKLARQLAAARATEPQNADDRAARDTSLNRSFWKWSVGSLGRWVLLGTALLVVVAVAGFWILDSQPSLASVNQSLAQAYTAERPFPLRFPNAHYGTLRQQRGSPASPMEEPQEMLDAKEQIARRLSGNPEDPRWLQAQARADLLEGHFQSALDALTRASRRRPNDPSIAIDLASAYFERGRAGDCSRGAELLGEALEKEPQNSVALFNRALLLHCAGQYQDAVSAWERYLVVDPAGEWSTEARGHLKEAEQGAEGRL
jgi:cytochrome c-type biogenesis protein CcmH/NrfG